MPPLASLVFLSCSRSLTSPRCRALPPAAQAARSLMAREKQMPPSASLVFLSCSLYREHSSLNNFAVRDEQASPVPAHLRSLYHTSIHRFYKETVLLYTLGRIPLSIRSLQKSAKLISAKFHSVLQNLTLLFFDFLRIYFFFRSISSPTR